MKELDPLQDRQESNQPQILDQAMSFAISTPSEPGILVASPVLGSRAQEQPSG